MSAGRPRRSAAPDSLRVAFPELTSSESESESDEEENGPGEAGEGGEAATAPTDGTQDGSRADTQGKGLSKKKKRKEPSPSPAGEPDSASGSEFELEVIKNKDGSIVQVEDEDDDDDFDIDVVEESESGDSAAGEKDLDNISIANSEGLDSESDTGKGKQGIKHGKARYFFVGDPNEDVASSGSTNNAGPAMRIIGRTLSATAPASTAPRNRGAKRKDVNLHLPPPLRKIALYDLPYGSAFWPPPTILTKPFDDPAHSPSSASVQQDDHGVQTLSQLSIPQRMMHLKRSAYLPFGPVSDNCVDLGWYKGKWYKTDQGTLKRSERWGGWYDTFATQAKDFDFVQNIDRILPHLPRNIYPALPATVHLDARSEYQGDKTEENEDDAWDQSMHVDDTGTPAANPSNAADIFRSEARHLQGHVQQAQQRRHGVGDRTQIDDDGGVRLLCGPIAGLDGSELPQTPIEIERFTGIRLDTYLPNKPGFAFNAGGPVWGLDWCPQADDSTPAEFEYLAVSTVSEQTSLSYRIPSPVPQTASMIQIWSMDTSCPGDMGQITTDTKGRGMRFDLALLTDFESVQLQWCPRGGSTETSSSASASVLNGSSTCLERLGLLAALSTQGQLRIYDIPKPSSAKRVSSAAADDLVFLKRKEPLLSLDLGSIPISCFEWASHERIIAGCPTGYLAVFDLKDALLNSRKSVTPSAYSRVHTVGITALAIIRLPPLKSDGEADTEEEPHRVATTGLDGSCRMVDLQDVANIFNFGHERTVRYAIAYQPLTDALQVVDQELAHRYVVLKGREMGTTARLTSQNGTVSSVTCSDFHPFFASASADGSATIGSTVRRFKRGGHSLHYLVRLYRMDFNRKNGVYRMLDNILPDSNTSIEDRSRTGAPKNKKKQENYPAVVSAMPSYAWSPEVAVTRTAWSRSIRRAHILASGMACGLVRVDMTASCWTAEVSANTKEWNFQSAAGDESD